MQHSLVPLAAALFTFSFTSMFAVAQEGGGEKASALEWIQDFAAAKAKAKAENKDLLVDFTGSDWCIWCKRLDGEVFAEAAFQPAAKSYLFVKLDFPNDKSLVTDEIRAQNEKLQAEFGISGFPTILLMDAEGRPYAQTGYQAGGPEKYLELLANLQKAKATRDEAFAKAKDATGIERAKLLAGALEALGNDMAVKHYRKELDEVIALDADNKAGLKIKLEGMLAGMELEAKFQEFAQQGQWDELGKYLEGMLTKFKGIASIEQPATFYQAVIAIESKQDFAAALKLIDAAKAIAPESEWGQRLTGIRKRVEEMAGQKDK